MTDPIADMLIRLTTSQAAKKESFEMPFSRMKFEVARILERTGFIKKVDLKVKRLRKPIEITLAYKEEGEPGIHGARRISRPGQRIYGTALDAQKEGKKKGIILISTSKGLMTAGEARKVKMGGEIICEVW